jgi:hypothetical protein
MALVLPVLLAMLFGLMEIGNMLFFKATVSKAAHSGARLAVTGRGEDDGTRLSRIKSRARELADTLGPDNITVAVRSYPDLGAQGAARQDDAGSPCELVEVEIKCDYHPLTPFLSATLPSDMTFTAKERMVNEPWAPCP